MGIIHLEDMEFYAYHGCFSEERVVGNKFKVSLCVETDMQKAAQTDNIHDALNYQNLYGLVKEQMAVKSHLLEHVAGRIIEQIKIQFPQATKAEVKVSKLNPPMGGKMKNVSVSLSWGQNSDQSQK
jgi:7,8-dihydroneopterin aldolase/epimerase/oxygenase